MKPFLNPCTLRVWSVEDLCNQDPSSHCGRTDQNISASTTPLWQRPVFITTKRLAFLIRFDAQGLFQHTLSQQVRLGAVVLRDKPQTKRPLYFLPQIISLWIIYRHQSLFAGWVIDLPHGYVLCGNYKDFVCGNCRTVPLLCLRAWEINLCQFSARTKSNNQSSLQYDNSGICIAH